MGWLSGWSYRRFHEIVGSIAGAVTDYQVRVKVYYGPPELYKLIDGGHIGMTFPTKPKALYEGTSIILPYQASDGNIHVKVLDASTLTETADYTVGADPIAGDMHGTPAIIKWGSYYVLVYGEHSGNGSLKVAYSTDLSTWTIYDFPLAGVFTYPQLFIWTDGNLYLFIRHTVSATQTAWRLYKCTDITNSSSWSLVGTIVNEGDGYAPYAKIRVEDGRLIVVWGRYDYGASADDTKLMCAYTDDLTTWYNTDGTQVTLPLSSANCLLCTLANSVRIAMSRAVGNTIYILPTSGSVSPYPLIEKEIGGTLNTYSLPVNYDRPVGMFYHTEGFIRFYITNGTKLYRCKFDLTTKTTGIEKEYPAAVYAAGEGEEVYGTDDWVIVTYYRTSDKNAYAHDILIAAGTKQLENYEVVLDGKCRTDFGDIRFTDSDGVTELSYWIEEKVDGDYATFWVKVPYIPASPNTATIYIYYGNPSATTTSDAESTFEFFDNFSTDTKWTITDTNYVWIDPTQKKMYYKSGVAAYAYALLPQTYDKFRLYVKGVRTLSDEYGNARIELVDAQASWNTENNALAIQLGYKNDGDYILWIVGGSITEGANYITEQLNVEYTRVLKYDGSVATLDVDGSSISESVGTIAGLDTLEVSVRDWSGQEGYISLIYLTKYIDPEPTHGVWGSEETAIKVWDGSQWKNIKAIYYWNGSSWVKAKGAYYWDGSQWVQFWLGA